MVVIDGVESARWYLTQGQRHFLSLLTVVHEPPLAGRAQAGIQSVSATIGPSRPDRNLKIGRHDDLL